jgi:hypothetical protein
LAEQGLATSAAAIFRLGVAPKLAVADGALGFWQAIEEGPQSRGQRCWVHKTANVPNKLPKSQQSGSELHRLLVPAHRAHTARMPGAGPSYQPPSRSGHCGLATRQCKTARRRGIDATVAEQEPRRAEGTKVA